MSGALTVTVRIDADFPTSELEPFVSTLLAWKARLHPPLYVCELTSHDPARIRARIQIELAAEALGAFLQLLRAWDGGKADRQFRIQVEARTLPVARLNALLDALDPPLPFRIDFPRAKADEDPQA